VVTPRRRLDGAKERRTQRRRHPRVGTMVLTGATGGAGAPSGSSLAAGTVTAAALAEALRMPVAV
jgi:hypothetical protein